MSTNQSLMVVGEIEVVVLYKPVKNLHLNVLPPGGKVRVTAPQNMSEDAVRTFIATRIPWIKKMQAGFKGQERQTPREYVSGETHYFFGNKYRLEVVESDTLPTVALKGKTKLLLTIRPKTNVQKREAVISEWYRGELNKYLNIAVKKWEEKIGVKSNTWGIRKMKTRWGSCNHNKKMLWFNLELVKKPLHCIDYVIVHELLHLIEDKHNDNFYNLLEIFFPKWRSEKEELNRLILTHEHWKN